VGVLACLGALALTAGAAVADNSAPLLQATVHGTSGSPTADSVSLAYLQAHPSQCGPYSGGPINELGLAGPVQRTPNQGASWTLGGILACLQPNPIQPADVTGITVTSTAGAPETGANSQITPADLAQPHSDFLNPAQNPVVWWDGNNEYDRPQRTTSDQDFLDSVQQAAPINIDVFEGPPVTVRAFASPMTVTVGGNIRFSETVTGSDGGALSYNWNFGGGASPSTQQSPEVQFTSAGVWTVSLEITDANGGGGGDQTTVTVNQPGTSSTPTSTGPTTTGPDKSAGTTPNAPPSTKKHKTGTQKTGTPHTGAKGEGKTSTHTHTTTTSTTTTTQTTTTQTTTTQTTTTPAAGGSGGGSSGSSGSPSTGASTPTTPSADSGAHHRTPRAPTHHAAPTPAQGTLVTGELVSDIVPLPADQSPLVHPLSAATAAAPARQAPERHSVVLPIIAAALAVLVLLGLGARRELGWPRWWQDARWWRALRVLRLGG
jgi:PKD repeat protein